jgi:hypothetical protein
VAAVGIFSKGDARGFDLVGDLHFDPAS